MWIDVLLGLAAVWHAAAAFYFLGLTGRMLGSHTFERPVNVIAQDMMQFLGAMNVSILIACIYGIMGNAAVQTAVLLIVSVANLSQFVKDVHAHSTGRWKPRLAMITFLDGFFGFVCLGVYAYQIAQA
ncbi:MAG TPA: hypothetical protein VF499_14595 [Afipia sp.]